MTEFVFQDNCVKAQRRNMLRDLEIAKEKAARQATPRCLRKRKREVLTFNTIAST